ncbi:MAG: glycerol dehydratase reactivase beta/small subunit family protein, partial [Deltaproteobacteria bacterium]|nr:glycerol dehydratase reactivase beta/small subunit family protein [Deltaproteobacteria bacterium]
LDPLLCGLEEEGIPAAISQSTAGSAVQLAKEAADSSRVKVGLGISSTEGQVVLHHHDLAPENPLQVCPLKGHPEGLRRLGANAARLVKGDPLLFDDQLSAKQPETGSAPSAYKKESILFNERQLDELAALIIKELHTSRG